MKRPRSVALALLVGLAVCAIDATARAAPTVRVGSKVFTESAETLFVMLSWSLTPVTPISERTAAMAALRWYSHSSSPVSVIQPFSTISLTLSRGR